MLGIANGAIASLVLALYINSPAVMALYKNPLWLWPLCLLLLYWISRIWLIAGRGDLR